jgi:hypothetical protein
MGKQVITYKTEGNSPVYTGVCVGVEDNDQYSAFNPDYGDTTRWEKKNWPWNGYSRSGTDPSYSRGSTHGSALVVNANEGQDRDRIMTWGSTSGKYPLARTLWGFTFDYKVSKTEVHSLHLRSYGVEFVKYGTDVRTWSSAPQSRGSTTSWQTITVDRSNASSLFNQMPQDDSTYIRRILILLSTRGGAVMKSSQIEFANFRYLYRAGMYTTSEIVLPPNRPYSERSNHLKLSR